MRAVWAVALALLLSPLAARAQGVNLNCLTGTSSTGYPTWAPASPTNPCPVTATSTPGAPVYVAPPSGTFNDPSSSLSPAYTLATANTDYTVVPALTGTQSRKALTIFNETPAATVTCTDIGNSATTGGSIAFTTYLNYAQIGFLPNGAVHCQSNTASTLIAVREAH